MDLHPTLLLWNGEGGFAKHDDVQVVLRHWYPEALPGVPAGDLRSVQFNPGIRESEIVVGLVRREMTHEEKCAAMAWLRRMSDGTRERMGAAFEAGAR